jgi:hypothetical protein
MQNTLTVEGFVRLGHGIVALDLRNGDQRVRHIMPTATVVKLMTAAAELINGDLAQSFIELNVP